MVATRITNPVTGQEGRCKARYQSVLRSDENDSTQVLTFDDVPMWVTAYFDDRLWLVAEKSTSLSHIEGRHLLLASMDRRQPVAALFHETWVNYFLRNRSHVHFNWWDDQSNDQST